jgi:cytochrome c oxidase cbb3-type subunit 4
MDAGTWRGIFTALMLLLFVAVCIWAYSGRRKADFEEASRLPLEEDEQEDRTRPPSGGPTVTERNK